MSSSQYIQIDPQGDMYLKTTEADTRITDANGNHPIRQTTLLRVSERVLAENSPAFKTHFESAQWVPGSTLNLDTICTKAIEIWLRIFHTCLRDDDFLGLSVYEYQHIADLAAKYALKIERMSVRFALWLGQQDLSSVTPSLLQDMAQLCQSFKHRVGAECIQHLQSTTTTMPWAFSLYPPIPVMSLKQTSYEHFLFGTIDPEDYSTLGFSQLFLAKYDKVTECYSDFYRLLTTPFDHRILPRIKTFDALTSTTSSSTFLHFCRSVDEIVHNQSLPPVARREMEAAWAFIALGLYEKSFPDAMGELRTVFGMRHHPEQKVEKYWEDKRAFFGWGQAAVALRGDHCEEPEYAVAEADEDEDDTMVDAAVAGQSTELDDKFGDLDVDDGDAEAEEKYEGLSQKELMSMYSQGLGSK
ncbi:hypothetical protein QTJ16_003261 [Diplocarpon rosae]|uniref:BTB domain-containing protein n=1 Tax=Diplocarpon rosae TaxID=946125 RepID=A0AAD9T0V6_9HELO|nr:hypothetical protein QTJ16_003261 [Diplocarpon rosae]